MTIHQYGYYRRVLLKKLRVDMQAVENMAILDDCVREYGVKIGERWHSFGFLSASSFADFRLSVRVHFRPPIPSHKLTEYEKDILLLCYYARESGATDFLLKADSAVFLL